jgi:hypothetical protein
MIEEIAKKLMTDALSKGKLEKDDIMDALRAAENEGFHIGYDESEMERDESDT